MTSPIVVMNWTSERAKLAFIYKLNWLHYAMSCSLLRSGSRRERREATTCLRFFTTRLKRATRSTFVYIFSSLEIEQQTVSFIHFLSTQSAAKMHAKANRRKLAQENWFFGFDDVICMWLLAVSRFVCVERQNELRFAQVKLGAQHTLLSSVISYNSNSSKIAKTFLVQHRTRDVLSIKLSKVSFSPSLSHLIQVNGFI